MLSSAHLLKIEQLSYEECLSLVSEYDNAVAALSFLEIPFNDHSRKVLNSVVKKHDLRFESKKKWKYKIEDVGPAVSSSDSFSEVCRKLNVTICTYSIKRIQHLCLQYNISTAHFDAKRSTFHQIKRKERITRTVENSLVENSTYDRSNLRKFLTRHGLFTNQCSCCGITEWQGKPITIEVDHINGISDDNRLENLRFLCPNCHSQTETFKTGNIDKLKPRANFKKEHIDAIRVLPKCLQCGEEFVGSTKHSKFCSHKCAHKHQNKTNWDEIDVIDMVENQKLQYSEIGRRVGGLTGAAVRRQYLKRKAAV